MAPLTFADTHNMIAFLTKSDASEGFNQIVDFLNTHTIQYALMVNPTIYVSCIKQFWASVLIKKFNDAVKLQALIDRKKALEIVKLKQRARKLEKKRRTKSSGLKRLKKDTNEAEPAEVEEVLEVVTAAKLMTEVVTTAAPITTAAQVQKASALRRRRGVVIQDPKEIAIASVIVHSELEAELNVNINWDDVMEQVKRREKQDNTIMRYQALKRKPVTEAQARKNMMIYLKNMAGFKMDFFRGMTYNDIRPIFEKHYNSIKAFLKKGDEEIKEGSKRKEPKNFSNDFLLRTLKIMFEKPNVEANIWRDQKSRYGLAKKYPLTRFTREQMLNNVRLEVEEESEMSLELRRDVASIKGLDRWNEVSYDWRVVIKDGGASRGLEDFFTPINRGIKSLKIIMENPNCLNEPNEAIPEVNLEEPEEDVDIELEDDAELIFPYEVEGDKTPPPGDVSI
nr:hypothetical protein [Tanacetum cinerariifolium]